jgi:hypothetical protein
VSLVTSPMGRAVGACDVVICAQPVQGPALMFRVPRRRMTRPVVTQRRGLRYARALALSGSNPRLRQTCPAGLVASVTMTHRPQP